eukprot:105887-Chlamydomonas_euryale.AAC.1
MVFALLGVCWEEEGQGGHDNVCALVHVRLKVCLGLVGSGNRECFPMCRGWVCAHFLRLSPAPFPQ